MLNKLRDKTIQFIQGNPKKCIALSLLLLTILAPGLFFLKEDYSYRVWYEETDPLLKTYDHFEKKFGNDDSVFLTIHNPSGLLNKESLIKIFNLTNELWKVDYIARVDSLTNFDYIETNKDDIEVSPILSDKDLIELTNEKIKKIRYKIKSNKLIENVFIASDETTAIIKAQVIPSFNTMPDNEVITNQVRNIVKKYKDSNHQIHISGTAILTHMYNEIANSDLKMLIPILYSIFTILLLLIYKRKSGVLLPFLIISTSIIMMMGTISYMNEPLDSLSMVSPNILLTVALADAIHILTVYFFGLNKGHNNSEAVRYSLTKNFYPTLLTSLTTMVGFFSFIPAKIHAVSVMGLSVGIGVIYAWFMTYFLLGSILELLNLKPKKNIHTSPIETEEELIRVDHKIKTRINLIHKYRYKILGLALVISCICLYTLKFLVINMDPFTQFKKDHPLVIANNITTKHIGPSASIEILIETNQTDGAKNPIFLEKIDLFQTWLQNQEYIYKTISIVDILKELNKKLHNNNEHFYKIPKTQEAIAQGLLFYSLGLPPGKEINNRISLKGDAIRLSATWFITNSHEANPIISKIESKARSMGLNAVITGKMPLFHDLTPYIVKTFVQSFFIALIAITIILIIVLNSFKLGILALIPNLFPLLVGGGIYSLFGADVDIASVLIVSVSLGIAVDDSIHFLFEYQKYKKLGYKIRENLGIIMVNTFPSLFNTTILIVIGFGSFALADYIPNAKFGIMVATILIFALLADFVILPAILMLLEKDD